MPEFKDQPLVVKGDAIYCQACKAEIGCEPRRLRQHCFQKQAVSARAEFEKKSEDERMSLRHYKKTLKLARAQEQAVVLQKAVELNRQRLLAQAEGTVAMRKNLDAATIARRVQVFETLAGAGIALSKLSDPTFLSLIEGDGPSSAAAKALSRCTSLFSSASSKQCVRRWTAGWLVYSPTAPKQTI